MPNIIFTSLTDEQVASYKEAHFAEYGEHISDKEAERDGLKLLRFFVAYMENVPHDMDIEV